MAGTATTLLTADEFHDFVLRPEHRGRRFELVRGEVLEMPRPGKFHGFLCGNLARILGNFAAARKKGYVCTNDTGILIETDPDTVRGPDLLFFDDVATPDLIERKWAETPAVLAVKFLSPNDTLGTVHRRVLDQLRFGTETVWVVDPEARNVTVYQRNRQPRLLEWDEVLGETEFLPGFRCKVADLFDMPGR